MITFRGDDKWALAVFLMDYHGGQWSRGLGLLCRMRLSNFSSALCADVRKTECYRQLVEKYADKV
jgi:hypothetical protein